MTSIATPSLSDQEDDDKIYQEDDEISVEEEDDVDDMFDEYQDGIEMFVEGPPPKKVAPAEEKRYVGLKNQGATCYMNSLLQTLYHIPYFRKAVYKMPTTGNELVAGESIPLALQSLFYKLQYGKNSVATNELTKSFGWNTHYSFMQSDVQEFNRVLCEKLEDEMKGTVVEGTIQELFEGHQMSYIECIDVDYKSTRKESFYDLQLDVKGCRDVYASFDKYVEVERLEGDNKYQTDERHGLQDAKKGVLFTDFPPVLQLQLKRYEYDFVQDTMVKINDLYEFPLQLDLDREDGKYLSLDADRSVRNLYTLHSVLVHSGVGNGGHYYAYTRPTLSEQWFKFTDERVTRESIRWAVEELYGGEASNPNAYMLVYIRESDRDEIMCNVDEMDVAKHLRVRFRKEQKEKEAEELKKMEEAEAARIKHLTEQFRRDIDFDLADRNSDQIVHFRSLEKPNEDDFTLELSMVLTYDEVTERVARDLGLDDPTKIRLTSLDCDFLRPMPQAIRYRGVGHLSEMFTRYNRSAKVLYYEVLDIPLPVLQCLKCLKVVFCHATKDDKVVYCIRLPKQSTVGDLINDLKTKVVELSHPGAELRLLEVFMHRIHMIFPLSEEIEKINDQDGGFLTLRAEEILEEEKNLGPQDRLLPVSHFSKEEAYSRRRYFGEPFFLVIHEGETLDAVKLRIQKKLQVPDEEFAKLKFGIWSLVDQFEYLRDSDIVSSHLYRIDCGPGALYLGLDHSDCSPKTT
ncbi:ubiquitin carboxyl-terminal hydrolase 13-like isoform X1 [Papaver somniferum]|uniref:ubiquitin carboxyl-terminal hydrolase 13-like isoform X1 n=2 Tax=Papaver somniferum TaxID=3469 RepID=UPI000E70431F|nr:ubiquitin carboxyl-terminal hydrolase 13-like isoform X1 [Papaver somniferum]